MPSLAEYQRELRARKERRKDLLREIGELIGQGDRKRADRRRRGLSGLERDIEWLQGKVNKGRRRPRDIQATVRDALEKLAQKLESVRGTRDRETKERTASEIRVELARLKAGLSQAAKIMEELQPLWLGEGEASLIPKAVGKALSLALKTRLATHEKTMAVLEERLKDAAEREELSQLPVAELRELKDKEELISRILAERAGRGPKKPGPTASERMLRERKRLLGERETIIGEITEGKPREEWDQETEAHVMKVRNYYDDLIDAAMGG